MDGSVRLISNFEHVKFQDDNDYSPAHLEPRDMPPRHRGETLTPAFGARSRRYPNGVLGAGGGLNMLIFAVEVGLDLTVSVVLVFLGMEE